MWDPCNDTQNFNWTNNSVGFQCINPTWNFQVISELIITITAFFLNSFVLVMFIKHSHIRTSFTVYLIFLLTADLFMVTFVNPIDIWSSLYEGNWPLGESVCLFYNYANWVFASCLLHMHLLITLNRIWAITLPVSYRNYHTKKKAVLLCIVMWSYVHLVSLPLVIIDWLYYREGAQKSYCSLNPLAQPIWAKVVGIVLYDFPIVFMVFAYPFLWYKQRKRLKVSAQTTVHNYSKTHDGQSTGMRSDVGHGNNRANTERKTSRTSFLVLTVTTISTFVCWAPSQIYGILTSYTDSEIPMFAQMNYLLYELQSAADPVLFAITLSDLKEVIKRTISRRIC